MVVKMYTLNKTKTRVVQCFMKNGKRVYQNGKSIPKSHRCRLLKRDAVKDLKRATKKSTKRTTKRTTKSKDVYTLYCPSGKKCTVHKVKTVKDVDGKKKRFIVVTVNRCKRVLCLQTGHKTYKLKSAASKRAKALNKKETKPFHCDNQLKLVSKPKGKTMLTRLGKDCDGKPRLFRKKVHGRVVHTPLKPVFSDELLSKRNRVEFGRRRRAPMRFGAIRPMNYGFRRFL